MRFRLVPTDDAFFGLFNDSAANVAECAHRLRDLLSEPTDPSAHEKIAACEHRGDELVHAIVKRLNTTFVTPFDREDIHALAEELDDVVDDMLEVSHRMQITGITSARPELKEQADLLVQCAEETRALLERLESMKGVRPISTPSTASRARATLSTVASSPACSAASSTPWRCCGGRTSSSRWSGR
jgi:hypothetical protein